MSDFANILYKQFFLRDILGKVTPGTIVLFTIYLHFGFNMQEGINTLISESWFLQIILFAFTLVVGVGMQILAEFLGLHSAHPRPTRYFFIPNEDGKKASEFFNSRLTEIKEKDNPGIIEQRERYVYLKEGTGNIAFALLISTVVSTLHSITWFLLIPAFISILLFYAHIVHRSRQAYFELEYLKLLPEKNDKKSTEEVKEEENSSKRYTKDELTSYFGKRL